MCATSVLQWWSRSKLFKSQTMATRHKTWTVVVIAVAFAVVCFTAAANYQVRSHSAAHCHTLESPLVATNLDLKLLQSACIWAPGVCVTCTCTETIARLGWSVGTTVHGGNVFREKAYSGIGVHLVEHTGCPSALSHEKRIGTVSQQL